MPAPHSGRSGSRMRSARQAESKAHGKGMLDWHGTVSRKGVGAGTESKRVWEEGGAYRSGWGSTGWGRMVEHRRGKRQERGNRLQVPRRTEGQKWGGHPRAPHLPLIWGSSIPSTDSKAEPEAKRAQAGGTEPLGPESTPPARSTALPASLGGMAVPAALLPGPLQLKEGGNIRTGRLCHQVIQTESGSPQIPNPKLRADGEGKTEGQAEQAADTAPHPRKEGTALTPCQQGPFSEGSPAGWAASKPSLPCTPISRPQPAWLRKLQVQVPGRPLGMWVGAGVARIPSQLPEGSSSPQVSPASASSKEPLLPAPQVSQEP